MNTPAFPIEAYSKVRNSTRAHYDRQTILPILDSGLMAHVGFVIDGRPMVIPMAYARIGDVLYIHGAKATRIIKKQEDRAAACVTITLLDGLVVGRSAFHHSANYRSVVVHGLLRPVIDEVEKEQALIAITNHLLPGRWDEVRPMNEKELKSTGVLALDIQSASAKIRQGQPIDEDEDYDLPYWGGVVPVTQSLGQPLDDGRLAEGAEVPASLSLAQKKFA
ncbi:MAG: pyridoxamine 5'-phosphate oxidase family protein [Stappiaceae bacterium]